VPNVKIFVTEKRAIHVQSFVTLYQRIYAGLILILTLTVKPFPPRSSIHSTKTSTAAHDLRPVNSFSPQHNQPTSQNSRSTYNKANVTSPLILAFNSISISKFNSNLNFNPSLSIISLFFSPPPCGPVFSCCPASPPRIGISPLCARACVMGPSMEVSSGPMRSKGCMAPDLARASEAWVSSSMVGGCRGFCCFWACLRRRERRDWERER